MSVQTNHEIIISAGMFHISQSEAELLKAPRVASSIVVVVYDDDTGLGGIAHMALPDSKMAYHHGDNQLKYVDLALPLFIEALFSKSISKNGAKVKIVGGSQLFNFGGGSGNILNVGTRNAITARTILTREGLQVEKTETGGNKARTVTLDMKTGYVQVFHPGENPRYI